MNDHRQSEYRYLVDLGDAALTPLSSVEAHWGKQTLQVLNISQGGLALLVKDQEGAVGQRLGLSVSLRGRAFPVEVEVRSVRGFRWSCAFVEPSRVFQSALREFLKPKALGESIQFHSALSHTAQALDLVSGSERHFVFIGENHVAVLVWTNSKMECARLMVVFQDWLLDWSKAKGFRTGRQKAGTEWKFSFGSEDDVVWAQSPEQPLVHYGADVLLAWLKNSPEGSRFVEDLFLDEISKSPVFPLPLLGADT